MSSDLWLTPEEVADLTGDTKPCKRRDTQCRRLAEMGIPFITNYGGRLLVERRAVEKKQKTPSTKKIEPNWDAMLELVKHPKKQ
ncbi:DUF4224 domain-containing protein [Luteibacter sp. PPL552]